MLIIIDKNLCCLEDLARLEVFLVYKYDFHKPEGLQVPTFVIVLQMFIRTLFEKIMIV